METFRSIHSEYGETLCSYFELHPNYQKFDHVEVSAESGRYMELISKKIVDYNGSALLIDYGHDGMQKDTLRAFKEHRIADIFEKPGECDLTCDVDFSFLKHIAQKMQGFDKILKKFFFSDLYFFVDKSDALWSSDSTKLSSANANQYTASSERFEKILSNSSQVFN
jgi:SAM-dependent MidA family methyltransferase